MSAIVLFITGTLWFAEPQRPGAVGIDVAVLSLRAAISEALATGPALQPARDGMDVAGIQERLERSKFGMQLSPALNLGTLENGLRHHQAGLTASRRFVTGTDVSIGADWLQLGSAGTTHRDAGVTLRVSQSLLHAFGPAPRAGLVTAARGSASAALAFEETRQQTVINTAAAYFTIVRQQLLAEGAMQARLRADKLLAASQARARVGLSTQLDVMRAELLAAQAEASLAAEHESLERARDDFKVLLGRPLDSLIAVDPGALVEILDPPAAHAVAVGAGGIERRADVREARMRVQDAKRASALARWTALPDIQLNVSYARRGLGIADSIFNEWLGGWRAGISTSYGLQRGPAEAATAAAAVTVRRAERGAFEREQAAEAEVRAARRAVARTAGTVDIQAKAVAVAERQARLAALRYERGLADNVDVIDAEMSQLHARTSLITARVEHAMARLAFARAEGRLNPDEYLK